MSGGHLPTLKQFRYGEIRSKKHVECLKNFSQIKTEDGWLK